MTDQPRREKLADAVARTVQSFAESDVDAAAMALADLLARQIDGAAAVARQADKVLAAIGDDEEDADAREMVQALRAKLTERDTLDKLGARLLAVLVELQATPKARGAKPGAGGEKASPLAAILQSVPRPA